MAHLLRACTDRSEDSCLLPRIFYQETDTRMYL